MKQGAQGVPKEPHASQVWQARLPQNASHSKASDLWLKGRESSIGNDALYSANEFRFAVVCTAHSDERAQASV